MDFNRPEEEEEQLRAQRRQRFSNTQAEQRYQKLLAQRAQRRQQLTAQGVYGTGGQLAEARKIVGTCTLMCPEFELAERELKNNISPQEFRAGTRQVDPQRTVKTFHRSAAGNEEPLPEDLRTPETLLRTLDYLVNEVIGADPELQNCHGFVRDRTRSIRQDFTIQNIRDASTVAACERIARFHILSLHVLCGNKDFAEQQDMEQLRNTLKTLIELYDDHRRAGTHCPNEPEFYAYYIVAHLRDSDAKRVAERLPRHIFTSPVVQQALKLHMLSESSNIVTTRCDPGSLFAAQNLFTQFFRAVASARTPPLMACLAEYRFPSIRRAALKAMCEAFPYQEGKEYPLEEFAAMLAFDSAEEVAEFCALFNVALNQQGIKIGERVGNRVLYREPENYPRRMRPNLRVVGSKLRTSLPQAINTNLDSLFLISGSLELLQSKEPTSGSLGGLSNGFVSTNRTSFAAARAPTARDSNVAISSIPGPAISTPAAAVSTLTTQNSASAFATGHGGLFNQIYSSADGEAQVLRTKRKDTVIEEKQTSLAPSQRPFGELATAGTSKNRATVATERVSTATTTDFPSIPSVSTPAPAPMAPSASASFAVSPQKPITTVMTGSASNLNTDTIVAALPITECPTEPEGPAVVWNQPRYRVNWTSLSNALYNSLVGSLTRDIATPITERAKKHFQVADVLAEDICQSIIDYTSAFVVYEEAYRSLLLAQADAFRRKSLLGAAISRLSIESVARQQERALHQRYLDDLDDIIDSEYMQQTHMYTDATKPPDSSEGLLFTLTSPSARRLGGGPVDSPRATVNPACAVPEGFWESLHLGTECFELICHALVRFGRPPFRAALQISGTQNASVLSSWLWWQIDPASINNSESGKRAAVYSSSTQMLAFTESVEPQIPETDACRDALTAQVVLLSPEPISVSDVRGGLDNRDAVTNIVAQIDRSLDQARLHGAGCSTNVLPVLFLFWGADAKATKSVRKLVDKAIGAHGVPNHVVTSTLALDMATSKLQLTAGLKWACRYIFQARKLKLIRASKVYEPIVSTQQQLIQRMRSCVARIIGNDNVNVNTRTALFNMGVNIVNAFIVPLNKYLLCHTSRTADPFPHATPQQGIDSSYFTTRVRGDPGSSPPFAFDAIVVSLLGEILSSDLLGVDVQPTLDACLRALEFVAKHQLDILFRSVPSNTYADKRDIADATKRAVLLSEQCISQAAHLCQRDMPEWSAFTTPQAKRSSTFAFSASPPSASSIGGPSVSPTASSVSTLSTTKRPRPVSSRKLAKLQNAMERASKHFLD